MASARRTTVPQLSENHSEASSQNTFSMSFFRGNRMVLDRATKGRLKEPLVICICGMAGSGKSTLAKKIAKKCGFKYYSGGDALKALAIEEGYRPLQRGWWETEEGMKFLEKRAKNKKFDELVDRRLLEMAEKGNVVLDSWTMPWLLKNGFKIWLEASPERRAERIAKRDKMDYEEALAVLKRKEARTKAIYKKLYSFSLGEDFAPFDFILDVGYLEADEVYNVLCAVIDNVVLDSGSR